MEFKYALESGKPIVAFVHRNPEKLPLEKSEKTQAGRDRLKKFRNEACNGRMVKFWSNKDELKSEIILTMPNLIRDVPTNGWEKSDGTIDPNDIPTLESDFFTGTWKSTTFTVLGDEKDKVDTLELVYDASTGLIKGSINRLLPEDQAQRKWNCNGCVVGDSIVIQYYSHKMRSAGCGLFRHYKGLIYRGSYLRYDYGTKKIDCIKVEMQKVDRDEY